MATTILVEDTLQRSIDNLVQSGQFASTADVVAHCVALIHEQQARVQAFDDAILQGWEDSQSDRIVDLDVGFDAIEAKWRDRIKGLAA